MIEHTARQGDQLKTLRAMRDKMSRDMDAAEPSVVAQIAGRLQAVLKEIAELERLKPETGSVLDELERKRAERESNADVGAGSARSRKQS